MAPDGRTNAMPATAIWALGLTQILGYGTLYYSFSILAPAMGRDLGLSEKWIFASLSVALFLGSLVAPVAGRLADRYGAGRVMTAGSAAAALALAACAATGSAIAFAACLVATQLAASFVLYSTAFVAIVQMDPEEGARRITHLTLIAGFASTIFWPLTGFLHAHLTWREVYLVYAGLNLAVCLPLHAWLAGLATRRARARAAVAASLPDMPERGPVRVRTVFVLLVAGFAIEGFVLSALLLHMVPLIAAVGAGAAGALVASLFGPAQVASRLVNMVFGGKLAQSALAVIATCFLAVGLAVLIALAPAVAGIAAFVVLTGLGSGLVSIVSGTLPLELFGRKGYGTRLGWLTAARQVSASFAPFAFAAAMAATSTEAALVMMLGAAAAGVATFVAVALVGRRRRDVGDGPPTPLAGPA